MLQHEFVEKWSNALPKPLAEEMAQDLEELITALILEIQEGY